VHFLVKNTILQNRQDACSTTSAFSGGVGILPAHKKLMENGALGVSLTDSTDGC
jgi:hypothetical protein